VAMSWDGTTFTLGFQARDGVARQHDIFFPYPSPLVMCDGKPTTNVTVDMETSTQSVSCDGGVVTLSRQ
jgi:hypothetical protein